MSTAPPIEPEPVGLRSNRGCLKGALLGCGGAAVVLIAALIGLAIYVQRRPEMVTDFLMDQVRARYSSEVTTEDKGELESAYADFRRALEARRVSEDDLERVRATVRLGREIGRAEVHALTRVFREAVGTESPQPARPPPTVPPAMPSP